MVDDRKENIRECRLRDGADLWTQEKGDQRNNSEKNGTSTIAITTNDGTKPLSSAQELRLKTLLDAIEVMIRAIQTIAWLK